MNKSQLIDEVNADKELKFASRAEAERAVNAVIDAIKVGIKKDGEVQLIGFGTFAVRKRKPREGRHPKTGKPIKIKASKTVGFRPGKPLKESV